MKNLIYRIKQYMWQTPLYRRHNQRRVKRLQALREPYLPALRQILGDDVSIISSNCFAGRIMQDLNLPYNTPTVGLYIWSADFIELLRNLKYYLTEAELQFVDQSKYPEGNRRRAEKAKMGEWYPIAQLDGKVEVVFLHYHSVEEAREKWQRRTARINWDNLFVIGMEQNLCTEDDIRAFETLPYHHKMFFSTKDVPEAASNYRISEFEGEIGNAYECAHYFYKGIVEKYGR